MDPKSTTAAQATETKKLTLIADISALSTVEIAKFGKQIVKLDKDIAKSRETERDERKVNAKFMADFQRRHNLDIREERIPADMSFAKYFERETGGKPPGRVQSLGRLFNSLVMMNGADGKPLLTETVYDGAMLDWLEKANAIIKTAIKDNGEQWKTCKPVVETIAALNGKADGMVARLDAIRKEQNATGETGEVAETAVTLTAERAVEFLIAFYADTAKHIATAPANGKEIFCSLAELGKRLDTAYEARTGCEEAFGQAFDTATLNGWAALETKTTENGIVVISAAPETAAPAPGPATAPVENLGSPIPTAEDELVEA